MTMSMLAGPGPLDGLNCPPFGLGWDRRFSRQIVGMSDMGFPYQAFDYDASMFNEYGSVGVMRIPMPLPPFFASLPSNPRPNVVGLQVPNNAGLLLITEEESFGWAIVEQVLPAIQEFARRRPLDLAIDGDSLTLQQIPTGSEAIHGYMNDLSIVASAISQAAPSLQRFVRPKPPSMSFYRRPDWIFIPRDDRLLATAPVSRAGHSHSAEDVVVAPPDRGIQSVGFEHRYVTQSQNSDGNSTSTTHSEFIVQISLPFNFGRVALDWRGFAQPLIFHVPEFDSQHTIYASDRPFATEVFRPMLRFLSDMTPPAFAIQGNYMWMRPNQRPTDDVVAWCQAFAAEFFSLVSDKVWHHLGLPDNPVPRSMR